ncbi:hypothetical protein ACFL2Q_02230 [Thermodesulfobacteriota bacterium]
MRVLILAQRNIERQSVIVLESREYRGFWNLNLCPGALRCAIITNSLNISSKMAESRFSFASAIVDLENRSSPK